MARKKKTNTQSNEFKDSSTQLQTTQQNSQSSQQPGRRAPRSRSKNYSKDEVDALLKSCNQFNGIINKNSNNNSDQQNKENAWEKIKKTFDKRCHADGIFVSVIKIDTFL